MPYFKQFILASLFVCLLLLSFSCNEDNKSESTDKTTSDSLDDSAKRAAAAASERKKREQNAKIKQEMLEKQLKETMARFETAFAKDPKDGYTWQEWLHVCGLKAQLEKPDALDCYDRFFEETKNIPMDENSMTTALRWRIIMALRDNDKQNAVKYWDKLHPIQQKMIKEGKLPLEIQAYSASIHSGILMLEDKKEEAVIQAGRAVQLFKESKVDDDDTMLEYLDKLIQFQTATAKWQAALVSLKAQEDLLIKKFGKINPMVAVNRLKRISILLTIDDKQGAIALWDYVYNIIGRYKKDELPKEINDLYVQTMIRLDVAGVLP